MISFLKGKILNKGQARHDKSTGQGFVIVQTDNIGYQVFVNAGMYADLQIGQEIELYIHHNVREDAQELYGFRSFSELEFFKLLISVSGIGPKSALSVLTLASIEEIKESIAQGDSSLLNKVSGIGTKTAERIVLELRSKIGQISGERVGGIGTISSDEIDALMALGYSLQQAREALRNVDTSVTDSGERIRVALRGLGK